MKLKKEILHFSTVENNWLNLLDNSHKQSRKICECAKIIRIEDASLSELLQCWLDITKGREIPPGSVVVIFSASHLLLEGLNGYISDLVKELRRFDSIFGGGLFAIPGLPVFLDGCSSPELIRDLWDMMCWLKHIGKIDLKRGWCALMESFIGKGGGVRNSRGTAGLKLGFRMTSGHTPLAHGSATAARLYLMRCRRSARLWKSVLLPDF